MAARLSIGLAMALAGIVLLAGCDQNKNAGVTVKNGNASVVVSANGQHVTVESGGNGRDVTISGSDQRVTVRANGGKSVVEVNTGGVDVRGRLPGFVAIYPGARVISSVSGNGGSASGSIQLETGAAPDAVIGFYKQKTSAAGFQQTLDANDAGSLLYAAASGKRTLQVLASKDSEGTHAQITWSGQ